MLSVGIDTALKAHQGEIQSENGKIYWHGRLENNKDGLDKLVAKFEEVIIGIYAEEWVFCRYWWGGGMTTKCR